MKFVLQLIVGRVEQECNIGGKLKNTILNSELKAEKILRDARKSELIIVLELFKVKRRLFCCEFRSREAKGIPAVLKCKSECTSNEN